MTIEFSGLAEGHQRLCGSIEEAIARVLAHGQFILGPEVAQLEAALSAYTGVEVVTCASGTDALVLAILASEIPRGSAVVVPTFTFCATAEAVCLAGRVPVFADVDRTTALMTPAGAQAAVDAAERAGLSVGGIIPVELFGQPIDVGAFATVTSSAGLEVIVDSAQSFGALVDGSVALSRRETGTTSFFPTKPLGCYGDGGAVFTADGREAGLLRSLRAHGQGRSKYENVRIGLNSRLDTIQAAILLEKVRRLDTELAMRRAVATRYSDELAGHVGLLHTEPGQQSTYAQYTITVERRDEVVEALRNAGVPSAVYYRTPLHQQTAYSAFPAADDLTGAEWLCGHVLSIPMHPYLSDEDVTSIVKALRRAASTAPAGSLHARPK